VKKGAKKERKLTISKSTSCLRHMHGVEKGREHRGALVYRPWVESSRGEGHAKRLWLCFKRVRLLKSNIEKSPKKRDWLSIEGKGGLYKALPVWGGLFKDVGRRISHNRDYRRLGISFSSVGLLRRSSNPASQSC